MAAPKSRAVRNLYKSLDDLIELVSEFAREFVDEDATQGQLNRFLVVRSCGFLETVAETCVAEFLEAKSIPDIAQFGKSWLGYGRNPKPGNLVTLIGRFNSDWARELQELFDEEDELLKREITALVKMRNSIAHGGSAGIGTRGALDFAEHARLVADWFVERLDHT